MQECNEEIRTKGKTIKVDSVRYNNKNIIIQGKLLKIARIKDEWWVLENFEQTELTTKFLKNFHGVVDVFGLSLVKKFFNIHDGFV